MADFLSALSGGINFSDPISMAINLILSTIIMGILIIVLTKVIARGGDEGVALSRVFMLALAINIINMPILSGVVYGFVSFIPMIGIILPLIIWILGVKVFLGEIHILHAAIIGIVGFVISLLVLPMIIITLLGFIPL